MLLNSPWSIQFATFLLFYCRNSNSRHSDPFSLPYLWQMSLIDHGLVSISPDMASWFFTTLRKFWPAKLNHHILTSIYHYFCMIWGHGNPLQYSCLESPMDRRAWWATVHGVSKSQTRLKRCRTAHRPLPALLSVIMNNPDICHCDRCKIIFKMYF